MWGYCYKVTCHHPDPRYNNKIYIGQHARAKFVPTYKGSGVLIKELRRQLGESWFTVELIERCKDQKELDEREEYWIEYYHSRDPEIGLNQSRGGRDNDQLMEHRTDKLAVELRESAKDHDPKTIRSRRLNDGANWVVVTRDGRQKEVFIDKLQVYLDKGWELVHY